MRRSSAMFAVALATLVAAGSAAPASCPPRRFLNEVNYLYSDKGYFLTAESTCVKARECPSKTVADKSTRKCTPCFHAGATACSDPTPSGTTSCGLFFDELSSQCVSECRKFSDGKTLPATFLDSSDLVCKPCGGLEIDSCDRLGVTGCRAPFALTWASDCVSREACHALGPSYYVSNFSVPRQGVAPYETGYCASCGSGVANAQRTGCAE
ncbi:hypothetical protein JCM9279_006529 [Rhodotorula babjevae]